MDSKQGKRETNRRGEIMLKAVFSRFGEEIELTDELWQYDFGQKIQVTGIELPDVCEVHFQYDNLTETKTVTGYKQEDALIIDIPNEALTSRGIIKLYIYLVSSEEGRTVNVAIMHVNRRMKPEGFEVPEDIDLFHHTLLAANEYMQQTKSAKNVAEAAKAAADADKEATEAAQEKAEAAQKAAENAETEAETAKNDAVQAKEAAEKAKIGTAADREVTEAASKAAQVSATSAEESAKKAETAKEEIQESTDQIQKNATEIDSLKEDLDNVNGTLLSSVFVESKNRYNKATSIIGTIGTQGVVREDASSAYLVSDYILLKSGKIYALSYYNTNYNKQYSFTPNRLVCFDLTKSFLYQTTSFQNMTENDYISYVSGTNENGEIYRAITPKQDLYVRFQTGKNFAQNMLQIGTDMIYENYFEDYYKVSLKKDIVAKENLTKELQEKIDSINSIQTEIDKIPVLENKVNPISESYDFNSIYSKIHRNVLFIGDSLTEGYQYKDKIYKDKSYPAFLSRMCDWNCTNKGQSGITTLGWWNAYGQEVDFTLYDAVFIYLGTNGGLTDTIDTDTASGDYNTFAKTNTGGYCAIVAKIRDVNPTCKIYIIKYADTAVSNITQKIADKYSCDVIVVLDTTHFTLNESKYHTDLTHYNTLGYYCFALNVLWQVEKIIKSKLDSYTAN